MSELVTPPFRLSRLSHPSVLLAGLAGVVAVSGLAVVAPATATTDRVPAATEAPAAVWTSVSERARAHAGGLDRRVSPTTYGAYHLDLDALTARLDRAPMEGRRGVAPVTVEVPSPSGELISFAVAESPVMEAGLAAEHPDIHTYAGKTTGPSAASIRLDVTPMGFHASVRGDGAAWYVDPAYNGTDQGADALYLSYDGADLPDDQQPLVEPQVDVDPGRASSDVAPGIGEGGGAVAIQRAYRLALVSDPSYATYFTSSTDQTTVNSIVTSEKATLMNRVDQVYGDDLSVRMLLVAGNDALNFNTAAQFTGTNGRCGQVACYTAAQVGAGCDSPTLDQNRYVVGQLIGAENYDIGHITFGPDGDGGGIAGLGVVGTTDKAAGCTGLAPPTGDGFAIDYVAHEMGHEFDGNHTFNGTTGSCAGGNRNAGTSVEPGSGTSVMAYAGICGVDDLQPHSDPYFSERSQAEIAAFTRSTLANVAEVQNVALSGFGAGESFTLTYGSTTSTTITSGSTYTAAGIKAAVEAAEPSTATATVTGYWGLSTALTNGFQITWSGTSNIATPTLTPVAGTFTPVVGTTDNGGPETNQGFNNPAPTGNHNPTVTAPVAKTIPVRTPFQLTGSATDPDGDSLVYLWEQNNPGNAAAGTGLNSNTKLAGPLFRMFGSYVDTSAGSAAYSSPGENLAGASPTRSFPDLAQVVAGATNAATGSCPSYTATTRIPAGPVLDCYSEFLPTTARTLSFRLTARDLGGADGGSDGGTSFADVALTVAGTAPFLVTSQPTATTVAGGSTGTVTWSTNTTTMAANVKISLSTDGGLTFPTVLSASTPNDGTQAVTWPNVATTQARIRVEAVDNYFYDLNDAPITITQSAPTATLTTGGNASGATFTAASSDALSTTPFVTASSSSVDGTAITGSATGLPGGLTLTRTTSSAAGTRPGTTRFDVTGTADADPGSYPVSVTVGDGAAADQTVAFTVVVTKDAATLTYTGDTQRTASQGGTDAVAVTVSASVVDTDTTPGTVAGTVAFTDQTTGEALCSAPVVSGTASCTFGADLTGTADRTYQVVATLTGPRYTGASAPAALVVQYDAGLVVTGPTPGNPTTQYSDALPATTFGLTSRFVDGAQLTATDLGALPAGVTLTKTTVSAPGARPGTATFTLDGGADLAPAVYSFTATFTDGQHAPVQQPVVLTVDREDATVTYTGPTRVETTTRGPGAVDVTLTAQVGASADGTPGDLTTASAAFVDATTQTVLCQDDAVSASGQASCTFSADTPASGDAQYSVVVRVGGRYTGASQPATLDVVVVSPADTTPPQTTITAGPSTGSIVVARDVVLRFDAEAGATYRCTIAGRTTACNSGSVTLRNLAAGSYDFTVAATDTAGNVDPTPALRRFYVPLRDRALTVANGPWKRRTSPSTYRGSYSTVAQKGATLSYRVTGAKTLALVVSKGSAYGKVDVFLGGRKLRSVTLTGGSRTQVLAGVAQFGSPTSGVVRIVTANGRPVRIEGLAVRTATARVFRSS